MKSGYFVRFKKSFVLLIGILMSVCLAVSVVAGEQKTIKASSANLYSKPDKKATVTDTLKKNDKATIIEQEGDWYAVRLADKRIGWIHKESFGEDKNTSSESVKKQQISDEPVVKAEKKSKTSDDAVKSVSKKSADSEDKPSAVSKKMSNPPPVVTEESSEDNEEDKVKLETKVKPETAAVSPKASEDGEKMATLKVSTGRVRSEPSQDAPVKFELKKGDTVSIIEDKDGWYHLKTQDGKSGWSHQSLFSMDSGTKAVTFKEVKEVRVDKTSDKEEKITFVLGGFYPPKTFVLEEETPKIVCDFPDTRISEHIKPTIEVNGVYLKRIRLGIHEGPPSKLRVVLDMTPNRSYSVKQTFYKKENYYTLTLKAGE